jgi:hypothetical protein
LKIEWARLEFERRQNERGFIRFQTLFGQLFVSVDPFRLFVQYLCYLELLESARSCHRLGIGIAFDLILLDNILDELEAGVRLFSLFCIAIFVLDRRALTIARLKALLGPETGQSILNSLFSKGANEFRVNENARQQLRQIELFFDVKSRKAIVEGVEPFLKVKRIEINPGKVEDFLMAIQRVRAKPSATFVLEEMAAPTPKDCEKRNSMVASDRTDNPTNQQFWSIGRTFSRACDAAEEILKRIGLRATFCEFDIEQILLASGIIPAIERRDRRVLNLTLEDLSETERITSIREFISSVQIAT